MGGRIIMSNAMGRARMGTALGVALVASFLAALAMAGAGVRFPAAAQPMRDPAPDTRPALVPAWLMPGRPAAVARHEMIAAANPLAVEAGLQALRAGGSAADAAVVVQLVLNLVEPQSSGIGGGAFALHWQAASGRLQSYDGRETAPAAATPERFLAGETPEKMRPMSLREAIYSGASVGVPGTLRLLEALHKEHGRLPWAQLLQPAIRLAEQGFPVSPRLYRLLRWYGANSFSPGARRYFFDQGGSARPAGSVLKSPELAATLKAIAERGADAFYTGPIAEAIVTAVRNAPNHRGDITLADLAGYRVKQREPVCFVYRGNRVCGMGPPSSGGLAVGQVLKMVEAFDLGHGPADAMNPRALHFITEAERLAFADRNRYIGD
ncbi:MAG TPA: gamma-glutamyltransferase, partial [Hyphomicrobiaceae bacterium]|nr:gamma-glutamyltransferase [Hyphomicrobiaceae bacterium]